ncbi:MAG: DUF1080 domain-containing protein [Leptolyngbya sp. PLA1]|nr:DUF1080 domain-containing protein [Leptolyngbya sp. PLA1]
MLSTMLSVLLLAQPAPGVSENDAARGFRLYSGADTTSLWRGYKQPGFPAKGWTAGEGVLSISKNGGGGDLITVSKFTDLDMSFEFKMGEKANSGIMFRVAETDGPTYMTGPEYQLLEDATYGAKPTDPHSCGALYDLVSPAEGKTMKPAGEWNSGRIYLRDGLLQHWLNGAKVVEARLYNADGTATDWWKQRIAGSKFKDWKGFGVLSEGHVAIQDHGDTELTLRNVLLRDPAAKPKGERLLFDGKSMDGWVAIVPSLKDTPHVSALAAVATADNGVLVIKGQPIGYIRTAEKFKNFILRLQWRFDPAKGAGNSGVLLRMVGEDKVWPKSVEAQLHSGNAGDFWNIDNYTMTVDPARTNGRNTKKTHGAERPLGEWNEYEIVVNKGDVVLYVNGEELNRATSVEAVPGFICLQSEGAEIHFRNVRLTPLPD